MRYFLKIVLYMYIYVRTYVLVCIYCGNLRMRKCLLFLSVCACDKQYMCTYIGVEWPLTAAITNFINKRKRFCNLFNGQRRQSVRLKYLKRTRHI